MQGTAVFSPRRPLVRSRRPILGAALALALVVWLAPKMPVAAAQDSPPAGAMPGTGASNPSANRDTQGVADDIGSTAESGTAKDDKAKDRANATVKHDKDVVTGQHTITITKNGKTVTVTGIPGDREFESFGEMVHTEPTLAIMIAVIVAVVFLSPVLAIALILAYRMRKMRMQNETMLKLAEKGIVAPAEAIAAVGAGTPPEPLGSDAASRMAGVVVAPNEQAKALRKRAAWSDLRKGVVMGAIGLGLTLYSVFASRSPNGIGLVLLFVGIGYVVLWWFEQRQIAPRNGSGETPPRAGPGGSF